MVQKILLAAVLVVLLCITWELDRVAMDLDHLARFFTNTPPAAASAPVAVFPAAPRPSRVR